MVYEGPTDFTVRVYEINFMSVLWVEKKNVSFRKTEYTNDNS